MLLTKDRVHTAEEALLYIADCNLATVCHMAMTKSRKKGEFTRQISIAQLSVKWIIELGIDYKDGSSRIKKAIEAGSVEAWAQAFMPEHEK
ncbi:MAG: hypothetical protein ACYC3W_06985 [Candidatus Nanopelagicales bacterium]